MSAIHQKNSIVPAYRLHTSSGQARVIINGEHICLGKFNSLESPQKYDRLIAEWMAKGRPRAKIEPIRQACNGPSVNELILAFWQYAITRYVKNGEPTSEIRSLRTALRPVRQLYGTEPVARFGPLALTASRQKLIEAGICRKRINQHAGASAPCSSGVWPRKWCPKGYGRRSRRDWSSAW